MRNIHSSLSLFLYTTCIVCLTSIATHAQFKVVGYLVNWNGFISGANAIDYTKVTHINVAFINPINNNGKLYPTTDLSNVVTIAHNGNAKILASIGGSGLDPKYYTAIMSTATKRTAFVDTLMKLVADYNLDGIDVDIEGDLLNSNGGAINSSQYESFVVELGTALRAQNKLMTAALGSWFGGEVTNNAAQQFDWINVMAYDAKGTWTGPGQHSSYNFAVTDLAYWNGKGVDKDHLVLGLPSYGYKWLNNTSTGSTSSYYKDIVAQYPRAVNQDSITPAPGQSIYYNGVPTIKDKTALALTSASGVMMWALQFDLPITNPNSLVLAIDQVIQSTLNNTLPAVSITSPANGDTFTEGDTITITANALDTDGSISQVSFYSTINSTTRNIGDDATAPYSSNLIVEGTGNYTLFAKAKDNSYGISTSSNVAITVNATTQARSFGGPYAIPGKIEAENFDIGNELGYHDSDASNQGGAYRATAVDIEANTDQGIGYNVGWITPGEWLSYKVNVTTAGTYYLQARVATTTAGHYFHVEMDGVNISGTITVPNTNGWSAFQTVTIPNITLTEGAKTMKLVFDSGDFNLNYINFTSSITGITDANASGSVSAVVSPNPFSTNARLQFTLKEGGKTKVTISNIIGASPVTITDQYFAAGDHSLEFGNLNIPAGIYLCVITSGDQTKAIKIVKE